MRAQTPKATGRRAMTLQSNSVASPDGAWEAIVDVTNLTDGRYFTNAFDLENINGWTSNVMGRPREWYITVRRNF